jgi:catechol 2,3-dioxygenase-like lactoylglutathione lyase family enzyme
MRPMPIRYVHDMDAARRFYEALGLAVAFAGRAPLRGGTRWVEMVGPDGGAVALHQAEDGWGEPGSGKPEGAVSSHPLDLSFEAAEPLEEVVARLTARGYPPATAIVDESFGRSFTVRDPEGLTIQVNEHDRELHG